MTSPKAKYAPANVSRQLVTWLRYWAFTRTQSFGRYACSEMRASWSSGAVGVTVAGTPEKSAVQRKVRELIVFARRQGYRREEIIELIEALP